MLILLIVAPFVSALTELFGFLSGCWNIKFINVVVYALWLKAKLEMSLGSRLKIENLGMFLSSVFYAVAGIVFLAALVMASFPLHLGIIGIFSLITAYGLFKKRNWVIWFIIILFFVATTFSAYILYYSFWENLLISIGAIAYLILTWIATAYVAAKRRTLEK